MKSECKIKWLVFFKNQYEVIDEIPLCKEEAALAEKLKTKYRKVFKDNKSFFVYDDSGNQIFDEQFFKSDILYKDLILRRDELGYVEYDLLTKKKYRLDCQEIQIKYDVDKVIIWNNGLYGVFIYTTQRKPDSEMMGFQKVIPIKFNKIVFDYNLIFARYQDYDLFGKQVICYNIYDECGNLITQVIR